MVCLRLCFVVLLSTLSSLAEAPVATTRIAFGSCANQNNPQPVWNAVARYKPDLFLMIGDNIYGDTDDMAVLRAKYQKLSDIPEFKRFRATTPLLGIWDDHDYGRNDVGVEFSKKKESQQEFLDFFNVPNESPRRTQEGVYHAQVLGAPGQRVQLILLDTRYFRSPLRKWTNEQGKVVYAPNTDTNATLLGATQWKWLEEQLRQPAELRLIASSIQIISQDHMWEKWMNLPHERERLFRLIRDTRANGVVLLSGDRHLAELSMMDAGVGYPLYDLTSSGLNQGAKRWRPLEVNRHRVAGMNFDDHFGMIEVLWKESPTVKLQIIDAEGDLRISQKLPLSLLQPAPASR